MQKYSVNLTEDAENDIAELMAFYEELVDAESATKFFDEAMETVANLDDYIYVNDTPSLQSGYDPMTHVLIDAHAGITNEWAGEEDVSGLWNDISPIWARPGSSIYKDTPQVFGHTPSNTCYEIKNGVWCIDTFSIMPDGTPVGDGSVLQIIDQEDLQAIPGIK